MSDYIYIYISKLMSLFLGVASFFVESKKVANMPRVFASQIGLKQSEVTKTPEN